MKKREDLTPHLLIDTIIKQEGLKNDAQLCRVLEVTPGTISKIRNGGNRLSPELVLMFHEVFGMPVAEIRKLAPETKKLQAA